jgi:hypothetical protein
MNHVAAFLSRNQAPAEDRLANWTCFECRDASLRSKTISFLSGHPADRSRSSVQPERDALIMCPVDENQPGDTLRVSPLIRA